MPAWKRPWCWVFDHKTEGCSTDGVAQVRCVRCGLKVVIAMSDDEYKRRVEKYGKDKVWVPR